MVPGARDQFRTRCGGNRTRASAQVSTPRHPRFVGRLSAWMTSCLIVEDDSQLAALLAQHLAARGMECSLAETLAEARRQLAARSFDVVVADLNLRDGRGLRVFDGIPTAERPPLVVMTGEASVELAVDALRLGAIDFLLKP